MTAPEHSPLPWVISTDTNNEFVIHQPSYGTATAVVAVVAKLADARFIIAAVNSHAELLATAKTVIECFGGMIAVESLGDECGVTLRFDNLKAAIKASEKNDSS